MKEVKWFIWSIVGYTVICAVFAFFFMGCSVTDKEDPVDNGPCKDKETRELSCPEGQEGRILQACIEGAWAQTSNDCKAKPTEQECNKVVFDKDVKPVIEASCKSCHSGFSDYAVAKTKIDAFIKRIKSTDIGNRMPKNANPLSALDIKKFEDWKNDGLEPSCDTEASLPFMDLSYQEAAAFEDSRQIPLGSQPDTRWISIAHKSNEGEKKNVLKIFEKSINKGINSLSGARSIVLAKPVDKNGVLFRINLTDYKLTQQDWKFIEANDPINLESFTNTGLALKRLSNARKPIVSVDAFLASAMAANTYAALVRIPPNWAQLLANIGVNLVNQVQTKEALQVGVAKGTISLNKNRLLLRTKGNDGPVWQAFDTDKNLVSNNRNLAQFPLILSFGGRNFKSDASEIIFSLANGLHGYSIFAIQNNIGNVQGTRLNEASTSVVAHNVSPPADPVIRAASSCFRCHNGGFIPRPDDIREVVERNATLFDLRDVDLVTQLYRNPSDDFNRDNADYGVSLSRLGILLGEPDPITQVLDNLQERSLGVKEAASYLYLTEDEFRKGLQRSAVGLQRIGHILSGSTISFQTYKEILPVLIRDMNIGQEPIRFDLDSQEFRMDL